MKKIATAVGLSVLCGTVQAQAQALPMIGVTIWSSIRADKASEEAKREGSDEHKRIQALLPKEWPSSVEDWMPGGMPLSPPSAVTIKYTCADARKWAKSSANLIGMYQLYEKPPLPDIAAQTKTRDAALDSYKQLNCAQILAE